MLNSKERAALRAEANSYDVVLTVGKSGIVPALVDQAGGALKTRELIKCKALETAPMTARQAADELAGMVGADVVQVIGRVFLLYRPNPEEPVVSEKLFGKKKPASSVRKPVKKPERKSAPKTFGRKASFGQETKTPYTARKSAVRFGKGSHKDK